MNERYTRLQRNSYIVIVGDWTSDPGLDFYVHSVHLLLVNKFGGIHKILAIKHYDSGCDGTRCPPEHHVCQGLRPCVTWKTERVFRKEDVTKNAVNLRMYATGVPLSSSSSHLLIGTSAPPISAWFRSWFLPVKKILPSLWLLWMSVEWRCSQN